MRTRNYSENTIKVRRNYFDYFVNWCNERGLIEPNEVSRAVVERFQKYLFTYRKKRDSEPLSFRMQHSNLVAVRAFFKWMAKKNYVLYNPASEIELPKLEKRLPKYFLSIAEAEAVLALPDIREPMGIRDRTILETFYSTGMRRAELMNLSIYDLDVDRGTVFIQQGKGKKDRMIPIGDRAIQWIQKYLVEVRPTLAITPDNGVMFLTAQGDKFTDYRLTQLVRDYVTKSDTGKKGACHLFRHTCATLMLEGGADIRFIQQQLGHTDLSTTEIYTQVSIRKLKDIHSMTHPGAKLEPKDRPEIRKDAAEEPTDKPRKEPPEEPPAEAAATA
jgi:integrase/recombinase XerD